MATPVTLHATIRFAAMPSRIAFTQEYAMPTEKAALTPVTRPAIEKVTNPLEARVDALERQVKAQQEVIDKLNAAYRKPWSSSGER